MFPGVDGFHWTFGHIVFLSLFFAVLTTIGLTVLIASRRSTRDIAAGRAARIRWHVDFAELPLEDRACRHEMTGETHYRTCPNGFDCRACDQHPKFHSPDLPARDEYYGLAYPSQRYYHRGHTWVEPQQDGTLLVGIDEIAHRLIGKPDFIQLPAVSATVLNNGTGWRMRKKGIDVRVLAPVDGTVVATGGPEDAFYLQIKPVTEPPDLRHLLHGGEVGAFVRRELERVTLLIRPQGTEASLADGGELIHDVIANVNGPEWDRVLGEIFLEP